MSVSDNHPTNVTKSHQIFLDKKWKIVFYTRIKQNTLKLHAYHTGEAEL